MNKTDKGRWADINPRLCANCGNKLKSKQDKFCCPECLIQGRGKK